MYSHPSPTYSSSVQGYRNLKYCIWKQMLGSVLLTVVYSKIPFNIQNPVSPYMQCRKWSLVTTRPQCCNYCGVYNLHCLLFMSNVRTDSHGCGCNSLSMVAMSAWTDSHILSFSEVLQTNGARLRVETETPSLGSKVALTVLCNNNLTPM